MSAMRVYCPHCGGEIRVDITLDAVASHRKGPVPTVLDPEIEAFILEGVEVYRSSFSTIAKLLEEKEVLTPKGSTRWFPASVKREFDKAVARRQATQTTS